MRPKLRRGAIRVRLGAAQAWFYENPKSIDVYIESEGHPTVNVRIPRELLADWLKRTDPGSHEGSV